MIMCPSGSFIYGAQVRYEDYQGTWTDDTALNGLKILCKNPITKSKFGPILVHAGHWGNWENSVYDDNGYWISANVYYEHCSGSADCTGMNGFKVKYEVMKVLTSINFEFSNIQNVNPKTY